jgi:hypothetical protein
MRFEGDDVLLLVGPTMSLKGRRSSYGGVTQRMMTARASSPLIASRQWLNCPTGCMWIIRKGSGSGLRQAMAAC